MAVHQLREGAAVAAGDLPHQFVVTLQVVAPYRGGGMQGCRTKLGFGHYGY
jgi:hypothetical protein